MSDVEQMRQINDLAARMRRQEAKALGPTLGEFYGQWLGLPGLRGLWFPGSTDQNGALYDRTGQGRTLTVSGTVDQYFIGNGLVQPMYYAGTGADVHFRADEAGLDIRGNETYILDKGLTLGGWFLWVTNTGGQTGMSKLISGDVAYYIRNNAGTLEGCISGDGITQYKASIAGLAATWVFAVCRYTPSTEVKLWLNDTTAVNVTSIPATIKNSVAKFVIGGYDNGAGGYSENSQMLCAVSFLAAAAWSDTLVSYLFNRSRVFLGV